MEKKPIAWVIFKIFKLMSLNVFKILPMNSS